MKNKYLGLRAENVWGHFRYALLALLIGLGSTAAMAQGRTVTGAVTDDSGEGLPGVNVVIKGTSNGTVTNLDGGFSISVDGDVTLVFSAIGFVSQEIAVGARSVIDVTLVTDVTELEEVVVVGYVAQTRADISGSVASVDVEQATQVPLLNAAEALEGRAGGVSVVNAGQPGSAPKINIRGFGTNNNTNPLYIIDGVQTDDPFALNSINPADIDQINILKDGTAAIYGARASNGVIIITTKSGGYNQDKATLSIDAYTGFARGVDLPEMMNPQQHGDMIFQSLRNDGADVTHPQYGSGASPVVPTSLQNVSAPTTVAPGGTDWIDAILRDALAQNVSISLSNGGQSGKYFMSAAYLKREGIQLGTEFTRGTTRLNSEFKINDKIRVGEHMNLFFSQGTNGNTINDALRSSPLIPVFDDNGAFAGTYAASAGLGNARSPVAQLERGRDNWDRSFRMLGDVYLDADIWNGIKFKTTLSSSVESFNTRSFQKLDPEHSEPISTNTMREQDRFTYSWIWNNVISYDVDFGDHSLSVLAGTEALREEQKGKQISRTGFLFEDPDFYLLGNGSGPAVVDFAFVNPTSLFSVFGTANYSFDDKYFATATIRRDRSSRFIGDNASDNFASFSLGWQVSSEDFFPQDIFLSNLKVRASWGQLGNQSLPVANPGINISSVNEQQADYAFDGNSVTVGAILSNIGNPDLKWETSVSSNLAFDLGFFDDALTLSADFYLIETEDLITQDFSLISSTAIDAAAPYVNVGNVENRGVDLVLGYADRTASGLSYSVDVNFSRYRNEVTNLISDFQPGNSFRGGAITRTQVGQPLSIFFGREVIGIFQNESEVSGAADQGFPSSADGVGRFRYRDVNDDGVINDADRTIIGNPHPDFTYGINLTASFKGFDISAFITGSQGNDVYNYEKIFTDFPTFFNGNRSVRVVDSWSESNPGASLPALSQSITNSETQPNSYFVEDGSFMRMRNLQIGYSLPADLISKLKMQQFRIYLQGTNLFTITGYDGFNPEIIPPDNGNNNLTLGVDSNIYPIAQILSLGVNVKF